MNFEPNETIAAIATGLTESGIGIIRISGPESYDIIKRIFRTKSGSEPDLSESHKVHYGFINVPRGTFDEIRKRIGGNGEAGQINSFAKVGRMGLMPSDKEAFKEGTLETDRDRQADSTEAKHAEALDEVLMLNMKGPRSYTGEDTIEIDCHGGVLMMKRILETVLRAGARPAEPGEFTKRAFLNGRIDLSQAEAVADIISAKNDRAMKASVSQLRGSISEEVSSVRAQLLEDTAYIEAALDDPEHIDLEGFSEELARHVHGAHEGLQRLIRSADNGKLIREGINTVILGKPNAGKSSLLNAMLKEDRAIVTDIAGTTRDTLSETINLNGLSLNIMDTAGIRETEDTVERIGVERALKAAENADLIIYVVDGSVPLDESDRQIIKFINRTGIRSLIILNKKDLERSVSEHELEEALKQKPELISISAIKNEGISDLEARIEGLFSSGELSFNDELIITSERQKQELMAADDALLNVIDSMEAGMSEDFYTIDLMNAYTTLGRILGESVDEDLVNEIFGKFCMGK